MANVQRGRSFGDYEIQRKLGRGGMASVFQAVHKVTGQEVALKILHDHYADDLHIRTRFVHEAQIVSQLSHPNIVPIWDIGEHKHRPFIVMPYMQGGSIAETFAIPGPLSNQTALQVLGLLASALDYAHSKEVVHRDFKLENILLTADHNPAIGDFGIAQSANTTRITMTGQILGSPLYMAPENFDESYNIDYRVDLYSFAVTAYVLFTGYFPFTGKDTIAIILKQRNDEAPRPSIVNPELPGSLDGIFSKALAKNPEQRFDSAQDLVESLYIAFHDKPEISTMIFLNSANPRSSRTPTPHPQAPNYLDEPQHAAKNMDYARQQYGETMPNVLAAPEQKKSKKNILPLALIGLLFLCGGISFIVFSMNSSLMFGMFDNSEMSLADESSINLISDNLTPTETATATSSPTLTPTPTVTHTPTITLTPSPTSTGTITATYTPTITRTPTVTPRVPTSTATLTATVTATNQPQSTSSSAGAPRPSSTRRPTNTPTHTPTNTPRPTSTRTPLPTNTRTPLPTNTPVPPTNTPVPPTAVPPTNTPVPPTAVPPTDPPPPTDVPPPPTDPPPPPTDLPPPPTDPPPPPTEPPPPPTEPPQGEGEAEGGEG